MNAGFIEGMAMLGRVAVRIASSDVVEAARSYAYGAGTGRGIKVTLARASDWSTTNPSYSVWINGPGEKVALYRPTIKRNLAQLGVELLS